jgi:hypothetical protein
VIEDIAELATDLIHARPDRHCDAGYDDAVFDSRRTLLVPGELQESVFHFRPSVRGGSTAMQVRGYPIECACDVRPDLAYDRSNREADAGDEQTVFGGRRAAPVQGEPQKLRLHLDLPLRSPRFDRDVASRLGEAR